MTGNKLATRLLNAVWEQNCEEAKIALEAGGDPSWIYNGYPLLVHAVFTGSEEMVMMLVNYGAEQTSEALGFALEQGIGDCVWPLVFMGVSPTAYHIKKVFGPLPNRYAPLDIFA